MNKRIFALLIITGIALIIGITIEYFQYIRYQNIQTSHLQRTKDKLLALANDKEATRERIAEIQKQIDKHWTDYTVAVASDGYVIYYNLHDSHGMDAIADINIFYLPDEKRFIVSRKHYCVDLNKAKQPKNKAELLDIIYGLGD